MAAPWPGGSEAIERRTGLCMAVRQKRAACRACVEVCPRGAITLVPGPRVDRDCDGCARCVDVCPTGALDLSPAAVAVVTGHVGEVTVACMRATGDANVVVPCLGTVSLRLLLGLMEGASRVTLRAGTCIGCPQACQLADPTGVAKVARQVAAGLGWAAVVDVPPLPPEAPAGPQVRRKGLFQALRGAPADAPAEGVGPAPSRAWLRSQLGTAAAVALDGSLPAALQVGRVTVGGSCDGCPVCSHLCPTGAIRRVTAPGSVTLRHQPADCVACGVCEDRCPKAAIQVQVDEGQWASVSEEAVVVAEVTLRRCGVCGTPYPHTSADPACAPCMRRYGALHVSSVLRRRA